jgi:hypothetical protein
MLSPIPRRILRDTATFSVPTGIDRYQKPQTVNYTVQNVHIQSDDSMRRINTNVSGFNTEVKLNGILFVDARYSIPALNFWALQTQAQQAGGVITCTVTDRRGGTTGPYTVEIVDGLPDDEDNLHHWELGLV